MKQKMTFELEWDDDVTILNKQDIKDILWEKCADMFHTGDHFSFMAKQD